MVGQTLKNGAVILDQFSDLVLAYWADKQEWVTWRVDGEGNAFWGHYFRDPTEARRNFHNRKVEYGFVLPRDDQ